MALQYSVAVRNAQLNAVEATVSTAPLLRIRTGAPPANCAAARTGTILCTITLPSDWMAAASSGSVAKSGTWSGTAGASNTAAHFEIMDSAGTTCHAQGTVTVTGGGGDMTLDDVSIESGQTVTISSFTITAANS